MVGAVLKTVVMLQYFGCSVDVVRSAGRWIPLLNAFQTATGSLLLFRLAEQPIRSAQASFVGKAQSELII
jgi:hypothetical protein